MVFLAYPSDTRRTVVHTSFMVGVSTPPGRPLGGGALACKRTTLMAIHQLSEFSAFGPEQIACMRAAYEDALDALKLNDDRVSELVARQIIEVARTGERARSGCAKRPWKRPWPNRTSRPQRALTLRSGRCDLGWVWQVPANVLR